MPNRARSFRFFVGSSLIAVLAVTAIASFGTSWTKSLAANIFAQKSKGYPPYEAPMVTGTCESLPGGVIEVEGTGGSGTQPTGYATLAAAFTAINGGVHTGTIVVDVCGNTSEGTATATLNASGSGAASYTTITISPAGGVGRLISGTTTAGSPMIDLNGADNVTIDGLNTGGNSLTIANTTASATSGTSTFRFIGGATNNTITNTNIQGSSSASVATNGGTIFFSTDAVTANGNDNNTISNNNIGPSGANLPSKAILGNGSTTTTAIGNSGNIIDNNNIFDYFGTAVTSSGVATNGGCNGWSITNNRFYQTGTRTWTTGSIHRAIDISNTTATSGAQGFTITGNIVGYASNTQTGIYTLTGAGTGAKFQGIMFNGIVTGTTTTVNNNTVAAISMTGVTGSGTTTASPFTGMLLQEGNIVSNGNTIGSQTATGSLTFSTTTTSSTDVYGIHNFTSNAWTSNNNSVGGISVTNLGASGTFLLIGMRAFTGTAVNWNATSNVVGGSVANSIQLTATGTASQLMGMFTSNAPALLTSNTIRNLTSNIGAGTTTAASVIGIGITSATPNSTLSQNSVFNLSNTNASAASVVTGIQFNGATANVVERNLIHSLTAATNSTAAEINGIRVAGGTTAYRNNMIAVGAGVANAIGTGSTTGGINGIFEAGGTNNFFHNSVYVGGAPTAGVGPSYALASVQVTVSRSLRDNIFFNARNNAGATGKNYALRVAGTAPNPAGLTINNNIYFANGTGGVFGFFNSLDVPNLGAWRTAVGQDAASLENNPQFNDPANASPDLHIHPTNPTVAEGNGVDVGVTNDFDGQTRSSLTPVDIGADAGNFNGVDVAAPVITYTPFANTSITTDRVLSATITDVTGVATGGNAPRVYYRKNAGAYFSSNCLLSSGTAQNGTWGCTIVNANLGGVAIGDVISYFMVAQDSVGNLTASPSAGFTGTGVNTVTTPPTTPAAYSIVDTISGTKTVCPAGCDFTTLTGATGAFKAINDRAATANIELQIAGDLVTGEDGTNGLNSLAEEPAGSNFTVKIYPTGAARAITGAFNGAFLRMNGASRVTIDGSIGGSGTDRSLTITNTSVTTPTVVMIGSLGSTPVTNDTLKNCVIVNGVNTSSAVIISDATTLGSAGLFSNITVQNNDIQKAFVGVFATGGTSPQGGSNLVYSQNSLNTSGANAIRDVGLYMQGVNGATVSNNTIANVDKANDENDVGIWLATGTINASVTNNTVSGLGYTGIGAFGAVGINITSSVASTNNLVSGNTVSDISSNGGSTGSLARGVVVAGATSDLTIERNNVQGIINSSTGTFAAYGLDISGGNNVTVKNNFVSNVSQNMTGGAAFSTTFGVFGIRIGAGTGHKIYNNSVNLYGPLTGTASSSLLTAAFGIVATTSTGCDVRNNIFANNITGGTTSIAHVAMYLPSGGTSAMNLTSDNNSYYFGTDAARAGVGQAGTTAGTNFFTTLASLKAYTQTLQAVPSNDNSSLAATSVVPFAGSGNFHITSAAAEYNTGVTIATVIDDLDGNPRPGNTGYEIGADEVADTVPPSISITSGPPPFTNSTTATFVFSASDSRPAGERPDAPNVLQSTDCKLDSGSFTTCTSPQSYFGLAPGSHTFTVRATDTFGNTATATANWTIDLVAPTVTSIVPAAGATNVPVSTNIQLNFSESVNIAAGGVTINCGAGNIAFTPVLPASGVTSLLIDPTVDLPPGSVCTVTGVAANITDTAGYQLDGNGDLTQGDNFVSTFTTACTTNPVVTNTNDAGAGSLRQAVLDACPGATITFAPAVTGTIALSTGEITIDKGINIHGPGANVLTVSGSNLSRIFGLTGSSTLSIRLSDLTLANGQSSIGGGAIVNNSFLYVARCAFSNNSASSAGGGAIRNDGTMSVIDSTFNANSAASGGAIWNLAVLNVMNSTFSGNAATSQGGAIFDIGNFDIFSSTFSGNTAPNTGGILSSGSSSITNTIIANSSGGDCGGFLYGHHNLIEVPTGGILCGMTTGVNGNITGIDPNLGPLANNGGPTQTFALLSGSPAINVGGEITTLNGAINNATTTITIAGPTFTGQPTFDSGQVIQIDNEQMLVTAASAGSFTMTVTRGANGTTAATHANGAAVNPAFDQRGVGFPRRFGAAADIGAFEVPNTPPTITPAVGVGRQQGSPSSNSQIATAGDAETALNALTLAVNGGATATVNGVTVTLTDSNAGATGINPNPAGAVFADVVAVCGATTATFNLTVTDGGSLSTTGVLTVTVSANTPPTLSYAPQSVVAGSTPTFGTANGPSDNGTPLGSVTLQSITPVTGGAGGLTLSVNPTTGQVQVLTALITGSYTVAISVADNCGQATTATFTVNVTCPTITVNPATMPNAAVNAAYGQTFSASPVGGNYSFAVTSGALPAGLTLNSNGSFSGAPTTAGTFNFRITATGFGGCTGFRDYSLTVNKANSNTAITNDTPDPSVVGQNYTVTATATSATAGPAVPTGNVTVTDGTNTCVFTLPATSCQLASTTAGAKTLTATYSGDANFNGSVSATAPHTVNPANTATGVQIAMNAPNYGSTLTATATMVAVAPGAGTPQGTVSFNDGGTPITGCQNVPVSPLGAAVCTTNQLPAGTNKVIQAVYSGNANFNGSNGSATQTIGKAPLNVQASSATVTYGDAAPSITSTITGFVLGETAANLTTQPSCSTTYTQGSPVSGSQYPVSCSGAVSNNYSFNYLGGNVTVNKKALTVAADNKSRTYGAANPALTATLSGFVLGQNLGTSGVTGTPTLSTTATATSPAGTYPIAVTLGTLQSGNYSFGTFTNGTLTVTAAQLTVTADNQTRVYGAPNPALTFQITGFVNGEGVGVLTGTPTISTTATATSAPGTYPITVAQGTLASANYTFATANGTLTVTIGSTTTTITNAAALGTATSVGQSYPVNWTTTPIAPAAGTPTGNVTVTDGSQTCTAAVAVGTCSLTSTSSGTKTITATYAGDANFTGSTSQSVQHNVVIGLTGNVKQFVAFGANTNLAGVTITLTNTTTQQNTTTTTDASGNYSFVNVTLGQNFTITPSGLGKVYEATSRTYNNAGGNISGADFLAYDIVGPNSIPRSARVQSQIATQGQPVTVPILFTATGVETKVSFSVEYPVNALGIPTVTCGSGTVNCTVTIDNSLSGKAGITVTPATALTAGTREIVKITFPTFTSPATSAQIRFGDFPTTKDVRNAENNALPTLYWTDGLVSFTGGTLLDGASISGRVTTAAGQGLRNATVTLLDTAGGRRTTVTSSFGNYQFENLDTGRDYMLIVTSKRYRFATRMVNLTENLSDVNLIGLE
ncbi:MAG: MBG domain-containing protein [Pyrinomonadaceae bacterium]